MKRSICAVILLIGLCNADVPSAVPDLDDFDAIKERCDKKGGAGTYDKIKTAGEDTQKCIKDIIDVEVIKNEVEEAKKTGSMDEVFGKYCNKRPQIKECVKKTFDAIQPCLEEEEKNALNITGNIVNQISDFACYRDGDRIAMFVAEKGVECLNSRADNIKDCVNQTLKFNPATFSPNSIPNLTIDKKKCDDLTKIQECIVKDLEDNCSSTTPANVIDAVFRFVKKSACKDTKPKRSISRGRVRQNMEIITQNNYRNNLLKKLKITCDENGGEDAYTNLMETLNDTAFCYMQTSVFGTPLEDFQTNLKNCTTKTRNALKKCLKEEEKYYPDFILEVGQSLYGFLYRSKDRVLVNGQPNAEIASCLKQLTQDRMKLEIYVFLNNTSIGYKDANTAFNIPSKSQICSELMGLTKKITDIITKTCIRDITIKLLVDDFVQSMAKPCESENTTENESTVQLI